MPHPPPRPGIIHMDLKATVCDVLVYCVGWWMSFLTDHDDIDVHKALQSTNMLKALTAWFERHEVGKHIVCKPRDNMHDDLIELTTIMHLALRTGNHADTVHYVVSGNDFLETNIKLVNLARQTDDMAKDMTAHLSSSCVKKARKLMDMLRCLKAGDDIAEFGVCKITMELTALSARHLAIDDMIKSKTEQGIERMQRVAISFVQSFFNGDYEPEPETMGNRIMAHVARKFCDLDERLDKIEDSVSDAVARSHGAETVAFALEDDLKKNRVDDQKKTKSRPDIKKLMARLDALEARFDNENMTSNVSSIESRLGTKLLERVDTKLLERVDAMLPARVDAMMSTHLDTMLPARLDTFDRDIEAKVTALVDAEAAAVQSRVASLARNTVVATVEEAVRKHIRNIIRKEVQHAIHDVVDDAVKTNAEALKTRVDEMGQRMEAIGRAVTMHFCTQWNALMVQWDCMSRDSLVERC